MAIQAWFVRMFSYSVSDSLFSVQHCDYLTGVRVNLSLRISSLLNRNLSTNSVSSYIQKGPVFQPYIAGPVETSVHHEYHSNNPNHRQSHPFSHYLKMPKPPFGAAHINRYFTHGENLMLHMNFISQLNCEDERQMALNLELKGRGIGL